MKNEKRNAEGPALSSLAMIWNALQQLEVGQVGVFSFDTEPKLLHPLDAALSETAGARLLESLTFDSSKLQDENSDYALLLDRALGYLDDCKAASSSSGAGSELQQVCGEVSSRDLSCSTELYLYTRMRIGTVLMHSHAHAHNAIISGFIHHQRWSHPPAPKQTSTSHF